MYLESQNRYRVVSLRSVPVGLGLACLGRVIALGARRQRADERLHHSEKQLRICFGEMHRDSDAGHKTPRARGAIEASLGRRSTEAATNVNPSARRGET